ncbi:LysM peptidoglycan-binding domain-containing protein [Methylosoma difficile]
MMHVNFNRLVNPFLVLVVLSLAGCSGTPKNNISSGENSGVAENEGYYNPDDNHSKLKFKSTRHSGSQEQFDTVWERLFSLYSLPEIQNPRVDRAIDWYLQHPASLAIIQQRAEPYLYLILDEIEAKGMPGELALLPVVESAFVPDAYSKADASGLWQFVPSTGEDYGLQQNEWYDGRRDIYASTQAATTYLKELSEMFDGDWLLALASYNCGQNKVKRTIEKDDSQYSNPDYWTLDLPQETQDYVPRLLAISRIFAHAEEYGINLRYIPNKPYVEMVDVQSPLDLRKAAQLANTPFDKFKKLNPGFNRSCTAPNGPHRLLVPVDKVEVFKSNLATLPYDERLDINQYFYEQRMATAKREEERLARQKREEEKQQAAENSRYKPTIVASSGKYTVKRGDTLAEIAEKNHTTVKNLQAMNHLGKQPLRYGMTLQVPSTTTTASNKNNVLPLLTKTTGVGKTKTAASQVYAVKKGDTIWSISQRFSVSAKDLADWNKITTKTPLLAGRKLSIKASTPQLASSSSAIRLIHYTVGKGDSLNHIAKKFNVSIPDLRKSNNDALAKGLRPGQKLKILIDGQPRS